MKSSGGSKKARDEELLDRGRLALKAIHYQEQIARYQAQALALKAAMQRAEHGDASSLEHWLSVHGPALPTAPHADADAISNNAKDKIPVDSETPSWAATTIKDTAALFDTIVESEPSHSTLRFDPGHEAPAPKLKFSWDKMERAALARKQDRANALKSCGPLPVATQLTDQSPGNQDSESVLTHFVSKAWQAQVDENPSSAKTKKRGWTAPHIWVSLIVHGLLVLGLSIYVVQAVQSTPILSIVSASEESDRVLMETPMESLSSLSEVESPSDSMSLEVPTELSSVLESPRIAIDTDSSVDRKTSASNALVQSTTNTLNSLTGSKIGGTEFFGLKATGNTFVYVVDNSPSMKRDGAFDSAKNELVRSLFSMKPKQRFHIGFFGDEMEWLSGSNGDAEKYPIYASPENLAKVMEWLKRMVVQKNGKAPNEALSKAIQMQPDGIFLLFDGHTKIDVAKFLRRENRSDDIVSFDAPRVPIHVVHFFNEEYQKSMRQIADENGGTYRFVPRPQQATKGIR